MRLQSGARRRMSHSPCTARHGSGTRTARRDQLGVARGARHAGLARPLPGRRCERLGLARDHAAAPARPAPPVAAVPGSRARPGGGRSARPGRARASPPAAGGARPVARDRRRCAGRAWCPSTDAGPSGARSQDRAASGSARRAPPAPPPWRSDSRVALEDRLAGARGRRVSGAIPRSPAVRCAPRRTRSCVYGSVAASSKSLTPQIRRPSASRQVPKFSTCRSPTHSTRGAAADSRQISWPQLRPAVEGGAQEGEQRPPSSAGASDPGRPRSTGTLLHEPALVGAGGLADVHDPHLKGGPEPLPPIRRRRRLRPRR